jgi:hypothetical protein
MKLGAIAHTRSGDKGNVSNIAVIALDERDYAHLAEQVTVDRVRAHLAGIARGRIVRYDVPSIGALNFVIDDALTGGVTRSLALDAHGKSLGTLLLDLDIAAPGPR